MKKSNILFLMFFLGLLISISVFVIDIYSPYGYAVWLFYILPVLSGYYTYKSKDVTYFFTALTTLLILSKFAMIDEDIPGISIFNRLMYILILWVVAYIQIQRRKATDGMAEGQERLQTMADSMPQMIWTTSGDGNTDYINKNWSDYTGLSVKEVLGSGWLNVFHPDDRQKAAEAWIHSSATGEKYEVSARIKRHDGQYLWHLNRAIPQKNRDGKIIKWYGTSTDMSDMMRLEEKINVLAKRFQIMTESNIVGIIIADLEGKIFEANDYFLDILEVTRHDFEEGLVRWDEFTPPEYLPLDLKAIEELRSKGFCTPYEKEYYTKKGGRKWVLLHDVMLPGEKEEVLAFILDITISKNALHELSDSRYRLVEAQRMAHIGSYSINYETNAVEWSDEIYRILGRDPEDKIMSVDEIMKYIHPEDYEYVSEAFETGEKEKKPHEFEYRIARKDGSIKYLFIKREFKLNSSGNVAEVIGTIMDITERKLQEQRLHQTVINLARSNRELEEFAYIASHDLQEPVRMISNYLGLFLKNYGSTLDEKAMDYLNVPIESAKRMGNLIRDLLTFSRVTSKPQPFAKVNLNEVLENVMTDLQDTIKTNQANITIIDSLPVIRADAVQMRQLFQNLISNAIKFRSDVSPEICIRSERRKKEWLFSVQDNGIGINPEYHEKVFQIFQRLHDRDKYPGTGIGLSVCKKIVERHNGRIWIESQNDKGCTFCFSIPDVSNY